MSRALLLLFKFKNCLKFWPVSMHLGICLIMNVNLPHAFVFQKISRPDDTSGYKLTEVKLTQVNIQPKRQKCKMIKRPPKSRAFCFERMGRAEHPPPPVYAFKCLLPVSSEMKGKVVCNASALSVSHLISCLTHYSDFSGQSSAKAVFLGFCSRLAFSSFPQSVNFT